MTGKKNSLRFLVPGILALFLLITGNSCNRNVRSDDSSDKSQKMRELTDRASSFSKIDSDSMLFYILKMDKEAQHLNSSEWMGLIALLKGEYYLQKFSYDSSLLYAEKAFSMATEMNDSVTMYKAAMLKGDTYYNKGQLPEAKSEFLFALPVALHFMDSLSIAVCYSVMGTISRDLEDFDKASNYVVKALTIAEKNGYLNISFMSLRDLAIIESERGDSASAIITLHKALEKCRALDDSVGLGEIYIEFGIHYHYKMPDSALFYYDKARKIYVTRNDEEMLMVVDYDKAALLFDKKDYVQAQLLFKDLYDRAIAQNNQEGQANSLLMLALTEVKMNQLSHVEGYLQRAGQIAAKLSLPKYTSRILLTKIEYFQAKKQLPRVIELYRQYISFEDSLSRVQSTGKIKSLQEKFSNERRVFEVINLEKQVKMQQVFEKNQHYMIISMAGGLIVSFISILIIFLFYRRNLKTQKELAESEELYRTILRASPDAIMLTDLEGRIRLVSSSGIHLFGVENVDELMGKNIGDLLMEEDRKRLFSAIKEMLLGKYTGPSIYQVVQKNGIVFEFEINTEIVRNRANEPSGLMFVNRDISFRRKAEEAVREARRYMDFILNSAGEGILGLDKTGRVVFLNPSASRMIGWSSEDIVGKSFHELVHHKKSDGSPYPVKDCPVTYSIRDARFYHIDHEVFWRKSGESFPVDYMSTPNFDDHGNITGAVITFNDITEQKRIQAWISQQTEELKELNATKDKFFSIIAHDLRSPFNSLLGLSNLMEESIRKREFDEINKYAVLIKESAQLTFQLLVNLLDWSRAQIGRMEFEPVQADLIRLIGETISTLNKSAILKSITIECDLSRSVTLKVDKAMIMAVLRNLINNAIKFTHPGGRILVSVNETKEIALISVVDNGVGIKPGILEKLFRIDSSHSEPGTNMERGTGLGLILCKEFVEKHGGRIWVESEPGRGSSFHFTIPRIMSTLSEI